ncbi:hypothetical protein GCM10028803_47270 [Larkinella knui]|uniref:hypothetical protein n=1 Tax=Larkinella knui TaxID=2025310 RepID=UPI001639BE85|nr:hypothetical protein [Larkinella knui]
MTQPKRSVFDVASVVRKPVIVAQWIVEIAGFFDNHPKVRQVYIPFQLKIRNPATRATT